MVTRVLIDGKNNKLEFRDANGNITFDKDSFYLRYNNEKLLNSKLIYNQMMSVPVPCDNTYTTLSDTSSVVAMADQGGHPVASLLISDYYNKQGTVWDSASVVADSPSSIFVITPSIFGGGYNSTFQLNGAWVVAIAYGKITNSRYTLFMRSRIAKVLLPGVGTDNSTIPPTTYTRSKYSYLWYGPTDTSILNLPKEAFGYLTIPEPFTLYIKNPPSGVDWQGHPSSPSSSNLTTNGSINISWYSRPEYFNTVMSL